MCVLAPGDLRRWPVACRELEVPLPPFRSRARNDQEKSDRFAIHAVRFPLFSPLISEINNKKKIQRSKRNLFKIVDFSSISRCFYRFKNLKKYGWTPTGLKTYNRSRLRTIVGPIVVVTRFPDRLCHISANQDHQKITPVNMSQINMTLMVYTPFTKFISLLLFTINNIFR